MNINNISNDPNITIIYDGTKDIKHPNNILIANDNIYTLPDDFGHILNVYDIGINSTDIMILDNYIIYEKNYLMFRSIYAINKISQKTQNVTFNSNLIYETMAVKYGEDIYFIVLSVANEIIIIHPATKVNTKICLDYDVRRYSGDPLIPWLKLWRRTPFGRKKEYYYKLMKYPVRVVKKLQKPTKITRIDLCDVDISTIA